MTAEEVYVTRDIDMSSVGIPTVDGVKEKMQDVLNLLDISLKTPLKLAHIEEVKGNEITFVLHSKFHYEKLHMAKAVASIEKALQEVFNTEMQAKIILKQVEVKPKENNGLVEDALRIFGDE